MRSPQEHDDSREAQRAEEDARRHRVWRNMGVRESMYRNARVSGRLRIEGCDRRERELVKCGPAWGKSDVITDLFVRPQILWALPMRVSIGR